MKTSMEWRVIGSNLDYQVSNTGLVRSIKFNKVKMIGQYINCNGYNIVSLCSQGKQKTHTVHRLVALAFIPNPDNNPQIDHINRIKTDNRVENLRWVTVSENQINTLTRAEHRHISRIPCGSYRVVIFRNKVRVLDRCYSTLDEAITSRDTFINDYSNYKW